MRTLNLICAVEASTYFFEVLQKGREFFFDKNALLSSANFHSAKADIKEAGNCYAVACNTACVFHCMRVLEFLSEAAEEFAYFKDGWRNYVSHNRGIYDEHQARSVLDHTCNFMNHLAKN